MTGTTMITANTSSPSALDPTNAPSNQPQLQDWSLTQIVKFCNAANLSDIELQSATLNLMNNKMGNQQIFQDDCTQKTSGAQSASNTMSGLNIAMTVFSILSLPLAIASCVVGPEGLGLDLAIAGAGQAINLGPEIASGVSSATLGTGLAVTQVQFGEAEKGIQTDTASVQNGGSQVKQLSGALNNTMKTAQNQGVSVSTLINNTAQAESAYKHKET